MAAQADVAASRQAPAKGRAIVQAFAGFASFIVVSAFCRSRDANTGPFIGLKP